MTVMIDKFFGVHPQVVRSGSWASMKPGEQNLYIYLMAESERRCTRELETTDAKILELVGVAPRTLCNARKKLSERGLIQCRPQGGNRYKYLICNPETGLPYPGDPKIPIKYMKKAVTSVNSGSGPTQGIAPSTTMDLSKPEPLSAHGCPLEFK
jgi:hypothetical protein